MATVMRSPYGVSDPYQMNGASMFWVYLVAAFVAAYIVERAAYFFGWMMGSQPSGLAISPMGLRVYFYFMLCGVGVVIALGLAPWGDQDRAALHVLFAFAVILYFILGMTQVFRRTR